MCKGAAFAGTQPKAHVLQGRAGLRGASVFSYFASPTLAAAWWAAFTLKSENIPAVPVRVTPDTPHKLFTKQSGFLPRVLPHLPPARFNSRPPVPPTPCACSTFAVHQRGPAAGAGAVDQLSTRQRLLSTSTPPASSHVTLFFRTSSGPPLPLFFSSKGI